MFAYIAVNSRANLDDLLLERCANAKDVDSSLWKKVINLQSDCLVLSVWMFIDFRRNLFWFFLYVVKIVCSTRFPN